MNELNVAQFMVTAVALSFVMTPLLVLAFLAGRRSSITGTNRRFERMPPDTVLAAGSWRAEFDGDDPATTQVVLLELHQVGGRIVGSGHSPDGTHHSLEGIVAQQRMCGIWIDENREGIWLGTVTTELQSGEQAMIGMRTRWSPQSQTLVVRKATFSRVI